MPRVLLVDDSPSVRSLLGSRLRDKGFEVEEAPDGVVGAEKALEEPPDIVVTDLWMPGISGVQLCRLLGTEARTRHVPVILVTAESGRRTRFWARCAGAAAYVSKTDVPGLMEAISTLPLAERPALAPSTASPRGTIHERLSQRLDAALFESVVAGEVRALAHGDGEGEAVFRGLARLSSEIVGYRWLALEAGGGRAFLHAHAQASEACEAEARAALRLRGEAEVLTVLDDRPLLGRASDPLVASVSLESSSSSATAVIAMGPSERGASEEERRLLSIVAAELAGPLRIVALMSDARRLALTDPLTDLLNRRAFVDAMNRDLHRASRHGHALSVLMVDVDHFKNVNDTHGHEAGDTVLKGVAAIIRRVARRSDQVGRWGGEEFVVGLAHSAEAGARIAAERVRLALAQASFQAPNGTLLHVTASIGVATVGPEETLEALVARADHAMYAAKARGRNRVETAG